MLVPGWGTPAHQSCTGEETGLVLAQLTLQARDKYWAAQLCVSPSYSATGQGYHYNTPHLGPILLSRSLKSHVLEHLTTFNNTNTTAFLINGNYHY